SMMNGSTGKEVCTNDKTKIKELITLLNNSHYKKTSDQKILIGYSFSYIFYVGNENILEITDIGNKIRINGIYYDVVERNFSRIKDWYNSL
ncbi:hypothetical protein G8V01_15890, partial [Clostridium botulinum D/C]|nr:hypothetical protein [Clostridium botulinum D/C]MCD3349345.1 hypothetical protein [Clostridium botulinum D/C]